MASQNLDPAASAGGAAAAMKGSEAGGNTTKGSVTKRCERRCTCSSCLICAIIANESINTSYSISSREWEERLFKNALLIKR